ncbi:MAG: 50S ribosomal protein L11 methyltransferase [Alistipes sp.]|jgi:ribosomal protein L11 methyltransferase|nr:50S ribosomal protein L11 methyltransferase [Alistipes sp.]
MNYIELNIPVAGPDRAEILTAELAEWPFDSFQEEDGHLKAYIPAGRLPDCKGEIDALLAGAGVTGARYIEIEAQNWNALWESQFEPVDVEGRVLIRAPFHKPLATDNDPTSAADFLSKPACLSREIVIMPKMSFGTGHHATTWLMAAEMTEHDFSDRRVLDMGSGTGVLAILAAKMGAAAVDAVDIDEWAYRNSVENIAANGVEAVVRPELGDAGTIRGRGYDTVLANINRNILLSDMSAYVATLGAGGELIVSGILEADMEAIVRRAQELGLQPAGERLREGWAALSFTLGQ